LAQNRLEGHAVYLTVSIPRPSSEEIKGCIARTLHIMDFMIGEKGADLIRAG
jgi:hypothetical protein